MLSYYRFIFSTAPLFVNVLNRRRYGKSFFEDFKPFLKHCGTLDELNVTALSVGFKFRAVTQRCNTALGNIYIPLGSTK